MINRMMVMVVIGRCSTAATVAAATAVAILANRLQLRQCAIADAGGDRRG